MDFTNLPIAPIGAPPAAPAPAPVQTSAHLPDIHFFLPECETLPPERRALVMTLRIDAILHELFAGEEGFGWYPSTPYPAMVMLWMCCHKPADWNIPGGPTGLPLYLRLPDLIETAQSFFEEHYSSLDAAFLTVLNLQIWNHHKGAEVVIDPTAQTGPVPEKKSTAEATPTRSTRSSTSSRAGTRSSASKPSTSRSGTPSSQDITTSSAKGLSASPRQLSQSAKQKLKSASGKRQASGK